MSTTAEVIRRTRGLRGWSNRELARRSNMDQSKMSRVERGEVELSLEEGRRVADTLGISLSELAGAVPEKGLSLTGDWWAGWQTQKDGTPRVDVHPLEIRQDGDFLQLKGLIAHTVEDGSYAWDGELRLYDNANLMGWYIASEGAVRSKGTLFFSLHPHGQAMIGGWVGLSYAAPVVRGWGAVARTRDQLEDLMSRAGQAEGDLLTWQMMNL